MKDKKKEKVKYTISSVISELSIKFGKYYKDINDVVEYVSKIRSGRK